MSRNKIKLRYLNNEGKNLVESFDISNPITNPKYSPNIQNKSIKGIIVIRLIGTNDMSGSNRWYMGEGSARIINEWLSRNNKSLKDIRGIKKVSDGYTFGSGTGYDWISIDLLCGNPNSGRNLSRIFESEFGYRIIAGSSGMDII